MTVPVVRFTVRGVDTAAPGIALGRPYTLVYDGNCKVCGRLVKLLRAWDRNHEIEVVPSQQPAGPLSPTRAASGPAPNSTPLVPEPVVLFRGLGEEGGGFDPLGRIQVSRPPPLGYVKRSPPVSGGSHSAYFDRREKSPAPRIVV
jgi:hypothetical protein